MGAVFIPFVSVAVSAVAVAVAVALIVPSLSSSMVSFGNHAYHQVKWYTALAQACNPPIVPAIFQGSVVVLTYNVPP